MAVGGADNRGSLLLRMPYLNAESCQLCVDAFAQAFLDSLNLLLLDKCGAHTRPPERTPGVLAHDCPELNPMERVWLDSKDALACLQFPTLDA